MTVLHGPHDVGGREPQSPGKGSGVHLHRNQWGMSNQGRNTTRKGDQPNRLVSLTRRVPEPGGHRPYVLLVPWPLGPGANPAQPAAPLGDMPVPLVASLQPGLWPGCLGNPSQPSSEICPFHCPGLQPGPLGLAARVPDPRPYVAASRGS